MAWFRVDDQLPKNRKVRRLTKGHPDKRRDASPFGIWSLAGAWSNDGFVPCDILDEWDDDWEEAADRLVAVGLWHPFEKDGEPGFVFHDWEDQNPTSINDPSGAGTYGNHIKWHVNRDIESDDCVHCVRPEIGGDIAATRGESDRVSLPPVPPDPTRPIQRESGGEEFDEFWTIYPRKEGKGAARKAWAKALKSKPAAELLPIVRSFSVRVHGTEQRFIPFPATWLNQERWADEVDSQQAEAVGDGGWFQPFSMPIAPAEVADDPEAYEAWAEGRRQAWRNGERW